MWKCPRRRATCPDGQDQAARLADVQWAVAREYGFASWPALKAHIAGDEPPLCHPLDTDPQYL